MNYTPIYEKDGKKFLIACRGFMGKDESEARDIGLGSMSVECVIMKCNYTKEICPIPENKDEGVLKVVGGTLGNVPVYLLVEAQDEQDKLED